MQRKQLSEEIPLGTMQSGAIIGLEKKQLEEILIGKIENYLRDDNPAPQTNTEAFGRFFSFHGSTGRDRAESYKEGIAGLFPDEVILLRKVYNDIYSENSELRTSKRLKVRLLEGLCEYLGIFADVIEGHVNGFLVQVHRHATMYATPIYSQDRAKLKAMQDHVLEKLQERVRNLSDVQHLHSARPNNSGL
ncbi:MAG: hypothetical protein KIT56_04315 [Gammaproteobacteria bacterium]|nr:hypothetical protein [Gammaproteobacteria bacterium]MCW5583101.1 hypothetical protein [Gammaproteobacteria bacterium]